MNDNLDQLLSQRETILQQMRQIDRLRRGTLSQQFFQKTQDGKKVKSGPYFVLQCFYKGEKCSERIPADDATVVQQQVDNYRLFQKLADDFVNLTEQLTQLEAQGPDSKKNFSNLKSPTRNSRKPKAS